MLELFHFSLALRIFLKPPIGSQIKGACAEGTTTPVELATVTVV